MRGKRNPLLRREGIKNPKGETALAAIQVGRRRRRPEAEEIHEKVCDNMVIDFKCVHC